MHSLKKPGSDDDDDDDSGNNDDRTTKEQIEEDGLSAVCEKRTTKTMPLSISFASTEGQDCAVKRSVNPSKMTAYTKQDRNFSLPADAVVCEVEIATSEQTIYYDDEILLTLDCFFVAGANHTESILKEFGMPEVGSLVRWSWDQHYGTKRDRDVGGCSEGINCEFPITQTNGRVVLKITDAWLDSLPDDNLLKSDFELSVIATGNQNADTDCTHSGLELSGTVKYLEK